MVFSHVDLAMTQDVLCHDSTPPDVALQACK